MHVAVQIALQTALATAVVAAVAPAVLTAVATAVATAIAMIQIVFSEFGKSYHDRMLGLDPSRTTPPTVNLLRPRKPLTFMFVGSVDKEHHCNCVCA